MKILFHHRIASRDGQAVHMEELIAALHRAGHETLLVGPSGFAGTGFGASSGVIDSIKRVLPGAVWEALELAYNLPAALRLWRAARRYRPDVLYERFSLFLFAGLCVRRVLGLPLLLEVNSPLFEERARNDGLALNGLGRWAQRTIWRGADKVLPVTEVLAGTMRAYGVPDIRIAVIPNGIDPRRFGRVPDTAGAKAALGLTGRLVLGFTGFVREWNAVHRLLDVASAHPSLDLHVLVVGDGPARRFLLDHAAELGISDRLTITGVAARERVADLVAAFDIALIPGVTPYASPLKLFEYLALGRAVVAPDTANIREILTDGETAALFDPAAEDGLETAVLRLCADSDLRERIGDAGSRLIAERSLTWDRNAARVVAIVNEVSSERRREPSVGRPA